jgi:hypothetical protein
VRANDYYIKECLTISLIVTYLFITLTYIIFLPKQQSFTAANFSSTFSFSISKPAHFKIVNDPQNSSGFLHRVCKSTAENKRVFVDLLLLLSFTALISLTLFTATRPVLLISFSKFAKHLFRPDQYAYLRFCSLRL